MQALHIFMLAIAVFLFVDALPCVQSKVYTIPLKKKHRRAHKLRRRALANLDILEQSSDVAYFGTISIGDVQMFNVQFDTGSADFFVVSKDCTIPACNEKNKYNPNSDENYKDLNKPFSIKYIRGSASGKSGTTVLGITDDLEVETQEFGLADNLSNEFADYDYDGVMGMALSSASANQQLTPITNLISANALDQPQFSFMFGRHVDLSESELTIGGSNQDRYFDPLTWTNLADNNQGLWKIPLDNFLVGGQPLNFPDRDGTVDTGTSLIIVPLADARQIYGKIPNSNEQDGRFTVPCDSQIVISLRISGVTWDVDSRDFIINDDVKDECFGTIEGRDTGSDTEWILGTTFLKNVYSVFDQGKLQVGFGKLKTAKTAKAKTV